MSSNSDSSGASRRSVLKGIGAGTAGTIGVTGLTSAASENDIYIVASDDFTYSEDIADKMYQYAQEVFYGSGWDLHKVWDYDMSGAPTNDDGSYVFDCDGDDVGLWQWWGDDANFTDDPDDTQLLMVPKKKYGGGCGAGQSAVAGVKKGLWELAGPDSGEKTHLIGDNDNDTAFGEKAASIARCFHEIGHCYDAGHADGHIWINNNVNRHSPMMLGSGQENTCDYDVNHCGWCQNRYLEGYANCETSGMPHAVVDFDESFMESI